MSFVCPKKSDSYYTRALELSGGDEQALYRVFDYWESLFPGQGLEKIVDAGNTSLNPISSKIHALKRATTDIERDDTNDAHRYFLKSNPELEINSMSRELDQIPEITYQGDTSKKGYADTGTNIHTAFEMIVKAKTGELSLRKIFTEQLKLPADAYDKLKALEKELTKKGGTLVVEQYLFSGMIDGKSPIAGASDIIRFNKDGSYDILDLKTASLTPGIRSNNGRIWDPTKNNYFKQKRYTTQLMGYGRMVERILHQTPANYIILPIEIETVGDSSTGDIVKFDILSGENIKDYKMDRFATTHLDRIFKQNSFAVTTQGSSIYPDESSSAYTALSGDVTGRHTDPYELALNIWKGRSKKNTGLGYLSGYYTSKTNFVPFTNQTDEKEQISQIETEFVNEQVKLNADLSYSVMNYLNTGDEIYIDSIGPGAEKVINLLKNFTGKTNIEVTSLNQIKGFKDKQNWILIKENFKDSKSLTHLLYVGVDNLQSSFQTSFNNDSVFGKFLSETESRNLTGTTLKNTLGDARSLEATMIAMKLKADNPTMRFGITTVFGTGGNGTANIVDLKENLTTLKRAVAEPILRKSFFTDDFMKLTSVNNIFDYKNYQGDWLPSLQQNIEMYWNERGLDKSSLLKSLGKYSKDASSFKQLIDSLENILNRKVDMGLDSKTDYNTFLISMAYIQLKGLNFSLLPENVLAATAGVPFLVKNPMLQEVNNILQNSQTKMVASFWDDYKTKYVDMLKSYYKSKNIFEKTQDRFTGDVPRHFMHLFKKMNVKLQTADGVIEKEITTFDFIDEESSDFKKLTTEEQKLIKLSNDVIQDMAKRDNIEWKRGQLPLVRGTVANKFFNAMRTGGLKAYTQVVNNYLLDLESSYGAGEDKPFSLDNIFRGQSTEISRYEMMGIQRDGFVNYAKYSEWSTNLEQMMDVFVIQTLKSQHLNEIAGTMRATKSVFSWYKSNLIPERLNTNLQFLNWFHTVNIVGRDIDSGDDTEGKLNRIMRAVNRGAGLVYIAADPITAAASLVGNELTLASQSIANRISGISGIKPASLTESKLIISKSLTKAPVAKDDFEKINKLMMKFRLFNQDMTQLLSGYHRESDKFLFRTKWLFGMMNMVDWEARASFMIGQMIEDGTWNAYSVDETGELVYDETKDKRLNGSKLTAEETVALRRRLSKNLGLPLGSPITDGYDIQTGTSIRTQANYLFGGYDKETKSMMNFRWWGKMFISQKNWLPAKLQRWTLGRMESELMGEIVYERDPATGELEAVWKGDQMEGIIMSYTALYSQIKRYAQGLEQNPWKSLTKVQKQNVARGLSDIILIGLATLLYASLPDDDDETTIDDGAAEIIKRGIDDLLVFYNAIMLDDFLWTPIPLKMMNSIMERLVGVATGGMSAEKLIQVTPIASSVYAAIDTFEVEDQE